MADARTSELVEQVFLQSGGSVRARTRILAGTCGSGDDDSTSSPGGTAAAPRSSREARAAQTGCDAKTVFDGCPRTRTKYLTERVRCSCLNEKNATILKSRSMKTGLCSYCGERKDRQDLQCCVACASEQYCTARGHARRRIGARSTGESAKRSCWKTCTP